MILNSMKIFRWNFFDVEIFLLDFVSVQRKNEKNFLLCLNLSPTAQSPQPHSGVSKYDMNMVAPILRQMISTVSNFDWMWEELGRPNVTPSSQFLCDDRWSCCGCADIWLRVCRHLIWLRVCTVQTDIWWIGVQTIKRFRRIIVFLLYHLFKSIKSS